MTKIIGTSLPNMPWQDKPAGEKMPDVYKRQVALSELTAFPPLNYCCYPSVSKEYIVPREEPWTPNKEALAVMEGMAEKVGDRSFLFWLGIYRRFSFCFLARFLANRLHKNAHAPLVDLLAERLKAAAALYPLSLIHI